MKGILFKEDMFRAIIEGWKTHTRRIISEKELPKNMELDPILKEYLCEARVPYKKGSIVYLKEPFSLCCNNHRPSYKYNNDPLQANYKWTNKLFMPVDYARYFILIENVNIEHLHDISKEAIIAEGIRIPVTGTGILFKCVMNSAFSFLPKDKNLWDQEILFKAFFAEKWCEINGKDSWNKNPWIWVYKLKPLHQIRIPDKKFIPDPPAPPKPRRIHDKEN